MVLKIRKGFNDIVIVHQGIIKHLKAQKIRHDQLMEKYGKVIEDEMRIPSNRFLNWTKAVKPWQDSVITSKLIDIELIQEYDEFIRDVFQYENDYIISESIIQDMEYGYDLTIEGLLRLEKKIIVLKKHFQGELAQAKLHSINLYQNTPTHLKIKKGYCIYCGMKLNYEKGDDDEECSVCRSIPDKIKPVIHKTEPDKYIDEVMKRTNVPSVHESMVEDKHELLLDSISDEKDILEEPEPIPFIKPVEDDQEIDEKVKEEDSEETEKTEPKEKEDKPEKPRLSKKDLKIKREFNKLTRDFKNKYTDQKERGEE